MDCTIIFKFYIENVQIYFLSTEQSINVITNIVIK